MLHEGRHSLITTLESLKTTTAASSNSREFNFKPLILMSFHANRRNPGLQRALMSTEVDLRAISVLVLMHLSKR